MIDTQTLISNADSYRLTRNTVPAGPEKSGKEKRRIKRAKERKLKN